MGQKLYVGNIPFSVDDEALKSHFAQIGNVQSAKVITDRNSGRSKGFGFVEMGTDEEAANAIEQLNGKDLQGRTIKVTEAKPQEPREGGRGGFGSGRGGFGGGRGGRGNGGPRKSSF